MVEIRKIIQPMISTFQSGKRKFYAPKDGIIMEAESRIVAAII